MNDDIEPKWEEDAEEQYVIEQPLLDAGWRVLMEEKDIDCSAWVQTLIERFPKRCIDVLGDDPWDLWGLLTDWWSDKEYTNPKTGETDTFEGWAWYYQNEGDGLRERLDDALAEIENLKSQLSTYKDFAELIKKNQPQ